MKPLFKIIFFYSSQFLIMLCSYNFWAIPCTTFIVKEEGKKFQKRTILNFWEYSLQILDVFLRFELLFHLARYPLTFLCILS